MLSAQNLSFVLDLVPDREVLSYSSGFDLKLKLKIHCEVVNSRELLLWRTKLEAFKPFSTDRLNDLSKWLSFYSITDSSTVVLPFWVHYSSLKDFSMKGKFTFYNLPSLPACFIPCSHNLSHRNTITVLNDWNLWDNLVLGSEVAVYGLVAVYGVGTWLKAGSW